MPKFRKKPVVIEATQWFKDGDHEKVEPIFGVGSVGYGTCQHQDRTDHGVIKTLEGFGVVCPGDWIICGVAGEYYPCKPSIFEATYEKVDA